MLHYTIPFSSHFSSGLTPWRLGVPLLKKKHQMIDSCVLSLEFSNILLATAVKIPLTNLKCVEKLKLVGKDIRSGLIQVVNIFHCKNIKCFKLEISALSDVFVAFQRVFNLSVQCVRWTMNGKIVELVKILLNIWIFFSSRKVCIHFNMRKELIVQWLWAIFCCMLLPTND